MHKYYVAKNAMENGFRAVHRETCGRMPAADERLYIGKCACVETAVAEAKRIYRSCVACFCCHGKAIR